MFLWLPKYGGASDPPPVPTALHKDVVYYQMQPYKVDLDLGVLNTPNTNLMQLCRAGALCDIIP